MQERKGSKMSKCPRLGQCKFQVQECDSPNFVECVLNGGAREYTYKEVGMCWDCANQKTCEVFQTGIELGLIFEKATIQECAEYKQKGE